MVPPGCSGRTIPMRRLIGKRGRGARGKREKGEIGEERRGRSSWSFLASRTPDTSVQVVRQGGVQDLFRSRLAPRVGLPRLAERVGYEINLRMVAQSPYWIGRINMAS